MPSELIIVLYIFSMFHQVPSEQYKRFKSELHIGQNAFTNNSVQILQKACVKSS